jgi:phosphoribosylformylglycinamidine synthase
LGDACRAFGIPITGGNVSLYNENPTGAIDPTPVIGMMGLFQDIETRMTQWFKNEGDFIYLLGSIGQSIGGSRYLTVTHGKKTGLCPTLNLEVELKLHQSLKALADQRLLQSAHDCSDGGFAVALAESCFTGATHEEKSLGAVVSLPGDGRMDGRLFGEAQSRVIVSLKPADAAKVDELLRKFGVPFEKIGTVGGDSLAIGKEVKVAVGRLADLFFTSIEKMMA